MTEEELSTWLDTFRIRTPPVLKLPRGVQQHNPLAAALRQLAQPDPATRPLLPGLPPPPLLP